MAAAKPSKPADPYTEEILVAVFDGAKARFFARAPGGRLNTLSELDSGLPRFSQDVVSDRPGRSFSSGAPGRRSAIEPKHDPRKMEKHNFVQAVVHALDDAFAQGNFQHLVVVAPERSLGEFRILASESLRHRIWREVPKELTQLSEQELETRLAQHLKPEGET